jgi:hypothetical protein
MISFPIISSRAPGRNNIQILDEVPEIGEPSLTGQFDPTGFGAGGFGYGINRDCDCERGY